MKSDDDKLFGELFGEDEPPSPSPSPSPSPAPAPAKKVAPAKPAPVQSPKTEPVASSPLSEDAVQEAAHLYQEMMAENRKAAAVAKASAPPPPPPPEPLYIQHAAPIAQEKPIERFADSVRPWTLFKGVSAIAMLVYTVGFFGRLLADSWPALVVITLALTALVLLVDYVRIAAANAGKVEKKKRPS